MAIGGATARVLRTGRRYRSPERQRAKPIHRLGPDHDAERHHAEPARIEVRGILTDDRTDLLEPGGGADEGVRRAGRHLHAEVPESLHHGGRPRRRRALGEGGEGHPSRLGAVIGECGLHVGDPCTAEPVAQRSQLAGRIGALPQIDEDAALVCVEGRAQALGGDA